MKHGKLIVFEGVSGTGKETQAKLLKKYLAKKHILSRIIFHPSPQIKPVLRAAKTLTDQIRILTRHRDSVVRGVIAPALARGTWIISLRNYISAYVYQGNGDSVKKIDAMPDYLFYFDITPKAAMDRVMARHVTTGEPLGKFETPKRLNEKRKKYKQVLKHIPHMTIDASASIEGIHKKITDLL